LFVLNEKPIFAPQLCCFPHLISILFWIYDLSRYRVSLRFFSVLLRSEPVGMPDFSSAAGSDSFRRWIFQPSGFLLSELIFFSQSVFPHWPVSIFSRRFLLRCFLRVGRRCDFPFALVVRTSFPLWFSPLPTRICSCRTSFF
jgi:hypothetical protein